MDALREVLPRALQRHPKGRHNKGLEAYEDGFTGYTWYSWHDSYMDELYIAIIRVLDECGLDAWKSARWEVYDKVSCSYLYFS